MRKSLIAALIFLSIISAVSEISFGSSLPAETSQIEMPEYFLAHIPSGVCSFEVSIAGSTVMDKQKLLTNFMQQAFELTNKWKVKFVVSGVNYISFSSFYVTLFEPCQPHTASSLLTKVYGKNWHWKLDNNPKLFATEKFFQENSPASMFFYFKPRVPIQSCLVSMFPNQSISVDQYPRIYGLMYATWRTFRLPFAYVGFRDRTFYGLFSRQCDQRDAIIKTYLKLMAEKDAKLASAIQSYDLKSGAADFLQIFDRAH
ncbi:MAG: hypothetical protein WDM89_22165 [Rhizomicrobium sp.]